MEQPRPKTNILHLHNLSLNIQCRSFFLMCIGDSPGEYSHISPEFKLKTGFWLLLSKASHITCHSSKIAYWKKKTKHVLSHQPHHKSQFAVTSQHNNSRDSCTPDFRVLSNIYFILKVVVLRRSINCYQDAPQGEKKILDSRFAKLSFRLPKTFWISCLIVLGLISNN